MGFIEDIVIKTAIKGVEIVESMSPMEQIQGEATNLITTAVEMAFAGWIHYVPNPQMAVGDENAPNYGEEIGVVKFLMEYTEFYVVGMAVISLVVGAVYLIFSQNGPAVFRQMFGGMLQLVGITSVGALFFQMVAILFQQMAVGVLDASTEGSNMGSNLLTLMGLAGGGTPLAAIAALIVAPFVLIAGLTQFGIELIRYLLLPIMVGVMPMFAALWVIPSMQQALRKLIAWNLALCAYPFFAAVIYASGFHMFGTPDLLGSPSLSMAAYNLIQCVLGLILMALSVAVLPALIALISPVSSVAGGGGGAMFAGAATGAGVIAQGAISNGMGGGRGDMTSYSETSTKSSSSSSPNGASSDGAGSNRGVDMSSTVGATGAAGTAGAAALAGAKVASQTAETLKDGTNTAVGSKDN